ncbi:MAG: SAM-dependent chlorinase/fluorinase [Gammaproteobacteria bacterium]|jgi:S-adenosylmethionine hydrolase|nr:SAM-dependent chlorinase/fluorinase [Gammaproteobacteria bacterium]
MIALFTDFGVSGPYVGQMKAVLFQQAPGVPVVDLFSNAPAFEPQLSAYLLAAYINEFPQGSVFLCVVDPGVGNPLRRPVIVKVDERWFVGPDNGLFNVICTRAKNPQAIQWWQITWQPPKISNSFHGRDLFAPVAARLAMAELPDCKELDPLQCIDNTWPQELAKFVYIDAFGNAMTGIRAQALECHSRLIVKGHILSWARTFSEVPTGAGFWYENANGLVEVAINQGRADRMLDIHAGDRVFIERLTS